jgi:hypothetical protein
MSFVDIAKIRPKSSKIFIGLEDLSALCVFKLKLRGLNSCEEAFRGQKVLKMRGAWGKIIVVNRHKTHTG